MPHLHLSNGWTLFFLAQGAFTVWMLVDASRRGVESSWQAFVLLVQPIGAWVYFFVHKMKDYPQVGPWLADLFRTRPSLEELRYRQEQSPTPANWLALSERLVECEEYAEARPHLEAVLAREPEHCPARFLLALTLRGLEHPEQAVSPLEKLIARHPGWNDYKGWYVLIGVCREVGNQAAAVAHCRELVRTAPGLGHKYLLAEHLLIAGEKTEARQVLEQGLETYRYLTGLARRRDARWVGKAKQLLKQTS